MRQIKDYNKEIFKLVNSLTIKMDIVDIYMEDNISKNYGIKTSSDKNEHKYYMNLKGIKHFSNNDIEVFIPDIDDYGIITKDNINGYTILKNELLDYGDAFKSLMKKYPTDNLYIRGILNPADNPVDAKDGKVLSYSKDLINENEVGLLSEIENFINKVLVTNNIRYVIDDLYIPSLLGVIFNVLPLLIYLFRSKKIRTSEVSDFDLYSYFGSYNRIEERDLNFLPDKSTILWLYSNLPYLKKEIGSNYTLDGIMKNVFSKNNIGLANIKIFNKNPKVNHDNINDNAKLFFENDYSLKNIPVNKAYKLDNPDMSLEELMYMEKNLNYIDEDSLSKIDTIDKKLKNILRSTGTKAYLFDKSDIRIGYNTTTLTLLFNNLMYYLREYKFNFSKKITNPSNGSVLTLNNKSAYYITLSCFVLMQGGKLEDTYINKYICDGIVNNNISRDYLIKNTILGTKLYPIVDEIISLATQIKIPITVKDFVDNLSTIKKVNTLIWFYISNCNDIVLASDLRLIMTRLYVEKTILEDNSKSLKMLLDENTLKDEIAYIDPQKTYETLTIVYDEIFNIKIDEYMLIDLQYKNYIKFMNKFKSYTVQFLYNNSFTNTVFNYFTSINIGSQNKSLIDVKDVRFKRFTKLDTTLSSISLAFTNKSLFYANLYNSINDVQVAENPKLLSTKTDIVDVEDMNMNIFNVDILEAK